MSTSALLTWHFQVVAVSTQLQNSFWRATVNPLAKTTKRYVATGLAKASMSACNIKGIPTKVSWRLPIRSIYDAAGGWPLVATVNLDVLMTLALPLPHRLGYSTEVVV